MDRNALLDRLSDDLLLEAITAEVEKVEQIPSMLQHIGYLDDKDKVISQINQCEIFESEPLEVIGFTVKEDKMIIDFEISFILSAWHNQNPLLRITAALSGKCAIPDVAVFDWESADLEDTTLVEIVILNYLESECDDLRVL